MVEVYDVDDPNKLMQLNTHDYIGGFKFTLGKVVSSKGQELKGQLQGPKTTAHTFVTIHGEEKKPNYGAIEATFSLECKVNSSSMVFITVNRFKKKGTFLPAYRTETKPK